MHVSVKLGQREQTLCQAGGLPQAQAEHTLQGQAELDATASLNIAGRSARLLGAACHYSSGSSQTLSEPGRLSETLYAGQFVVRYLARRGLFIPSGYQVHTLSKSLDEELCKNASR